MGGVVIPAYRIPHRISGGLVSPSPLSNGTHDNDGSGSARESVAGAVTIGIDKAVGHDWLVLCLLQFFRAGIIGCDIRVVLGGMNYLSRFQWGLDGLQVGAEDAS